MPHFIIKSFLILHACPKLNRSSSFPSFQLLLPDSLSLPMMLSFTVPHTLHPWLSHHLHGGPHTIPMAPPLHWLTAHAQTLWSLPGGLLPTPGIPCSQILNTFLNYPSDPLCCLLKHLHWLPIISFVKCDVSPGALDSGPWVSGNVWSCLSFGFLILPFFFLYFKTCHTFKRLFLRDVQLFL